MKNNNQINEVAVLKQLSFIYCLIILDINNLLK